MKSTLSGSSTLFDAIEIIESSPRRIAVVLSPKKTVMGTLTDGDIRRAIIKGAKFSSAIENYYFKKPFFIKNKSHIIQS